MALKTLVRSRSAIEDVPGMAAAYELATDGNAAFDGDVVEHGDVAEFWTHLIEAGDWQRIFDAERLDRVAAIQSGLEAATLRVLAEHMTWSVSSLSSSLGLAYSTMRRKAKDNEKLSSSDSERLLGLASLIGQVESMLTDDRPADFDAARWVAGWVGQPHAALGGRKPDELLDTTTGQSLVADVLGSAASGAYW